MQPAEQVQSNTVVFLLLPHPPIHLLLLLLSARERPQLLGVSPHTHLVFVCSCCFLLKHKRHLTLIKMAMVLAYWDIRGLAQPVRLLLEYTGTAYDEKFYTCGEAPDYDRSCWFGEKEKLGIDFPNLPYLLDGDRKITQSNAIMRYIARKHNLCGETEDEKVRVDLLENQAMDFRNGFVRLCYTDFEKLKPGYLSSLQGTLKQFSDFLGDRKWFAGDKITFVDFVMYELLDQHRMFHSSCLDDFKNLKDFLDRFEALEKIAAYMKSSRFIKTPVNNKMAKWGHKKE
uniref:glutathione transferase n=2 Tax=Poecilia reticulata TaxID=8081 RepID=A0A3P9PK40_POERE